MRHYHPKRLTHNRGAANMSVLLIYRCRNSRERAVWSARSRLSKPQ